MKRIAPIVSAVSSLPRFGSMREMSTALKIPYSVLLEAGRKGCRFKDDHGRCDGSAFLEWFFAQKGDDVDDASRLKRAQATLKELEVEKAQEKLIPFDAVDDFIRNLVNVVFFGELERAASEWPAMLKGKTEIEILGEVQGFVEQAKAGLEDALASWEKTKGAGKK